MEDSVTERIETHSYPAETGELAAALGEVDEAAAEAVQRAGNGTITDPDDARLTLQCGLGGEAVGRRRYSDRDPGAVGERRYRRLSF